MVSVRPGQQVTQSVAGGELYQLDAPWWPTWTHDRVQVTSIPPQHDEALKIRRLEDGEIVRATSWVAPGERLSSPVQLLAIGGVAGALYRIQVTSDSWFSILMID